MSRPKLKILLGPCDDEGRVWLNNARVLTTQLNQSDVHVQELDDGEYRIRFELWNTGGWGWNYNLEIRVGNIRLGPFSATGGSGGYNGRIDEHTMTWYFEVKDGVVGTVT